MRTPGFWQQKSFLSTLLSPFGALYGLAARYGRTHTKPERAPLPVIAIGNATAGGAGKTPTAIALAQLLRSMGHTPHLISRGYGGRIRTTHRVSSTDTFRQVGDEPLLLAQHAPTWIGPRRIDSARAAQQNGATLVIADDALQHHPLYKDVTLLVVDGGFGIGNGRLLPAGPLREPLADALLRSDAVILIGGNRQNLMFDKPTFHATLAPHGDTGWIRGAKLLAFAGLARPQKFYDTLRGLGADLIATKDFPDHHPFSTSELEKICRTAERAGAMPIATAKDAVKFPPGFNHRIRVLEVALSLDDMAGFQNWLQSALPRPI